MTDCNKMTTWQIISTLGIAGYFQWRRGRQAEALEKAERKAAKLRAAIESLKSKVNGA